MKTIDRFDNYHITEYNISGDGQGFMPSHVYENPEYAVGTWVLIDYALLFVASVCDYYTVIE